MSSIRDFLSLRPRASDRTFEGLTGDDNQALYLTPANLTFPGVTVVAGVLLNFFVTNIGGARLLIALVIAVLFGAVVVALALTDPNGLGKSETTGRDRFRAIIVGLINTLLLWIAIFGVSHAPLPNVGGG